MKKLTLQLDDLKVETFATTGTSRADGTVFGHATEYPGCSTEHLYNCTDPYTDEKECGPSGGTCFGQSCNSTCFQRICECTAGGDYTMCDYTCSTCLNECPTDASCMTQPGYQGC